MLPRACPNIQYHMNYEKQGLIQEARREELNVFETRKADIEASTESQIASLVKIIESQKDAMRGALAEEGGKEYRDQDYEKIFGAEKGYENLSEPYREAIKNIKDFRETQIEAIKPLEIKLEDLKGQIEQKRGKIVETQMLRASGAFSELCSYADLLEKEIGLSLYGYNGEQYNPEILLENLKEVDQIFGELGKQASKVHYSTSPTVWESVVAEALLKCEERLTQFLSDRVKHFADTFKQRIAHKAGEADYSSDKTLSKPDRMRFVKNYYGELFKRRREGSFLTYFLKEDENDRGLHYEKSLAMRINSLNKKYEPPEGVEKEWEVTMERQKQSKVDDIIGEIRYNCGSLGSFGDPLKPDSFRP